MSSTSPVVPAPHPDDPEDVRDALAIANTVWNRGEKGDAVGWIRRAAEAAEEWGHSARAGELQEHAQAASNVARLAIAHPDPQELSAEIFVLKTPLPTSAQVIPPNAVPTPMPSGARVGTPLPTPTPVAAPKPSADGTGANRVPMPSTKPSADASGGNRAILAPTRTPTDPKKPTPAGKPSVPRATPTPPKTTGAKSSAANAKVSAPEARVGGATMPDFSRVDAPAASSSAIHTPLPAATIRERERDLSPMPIEAPSDSDISLHISLDVPNDLESTTQGPALTMAAILAATGRGGRAGDAMADEDDIQSLDDESGDTVTKPLEGEDRKIVAQVAASYKKGSADASGPVPAMSARNEPPGLRTAVAVRVRVYPSEAGAWIMPEQPGDTDGVSAMLVALDDYDLRKLFPQNSGRKR
ncbi:MAG: hypothetical protein ACHREM_13830 [Polyangiales bacterium]